MFQYKYKHHKHIFLSVEPIHKVCSTYFIETLLTNPHYPYMIKIRMSNFINQMCKGMKGKEMKGRKKKCLNLNILNIFNHKIIFTLF